MKKVKYLISAGSLALVLISCEKTMQESSDAVALRADNNNVQAAEKSSAGYVYTLNNQAINKVMAFSRDASGRLEYVAAYPTGGAGTAMGTGSQGALAWSETYNLLLAVNPGSNSVSSMSGTGLQQISTVSSGGTSPISVTTYNDLVYVLNGGGTGNISGFRMSADGHLTAIASSTRSLSSSSAGPAQVSFVNDGQVLVVTEKATNHITTYTVNGAGLTGTMTVTTSAHPTPFGFAEGKNGIIYVSEAAGGAAGQSAVSAYRVSSNGMVTLTAGPVMANQSAACWVVTNNNGKYVYSTNTASNTVSSFATVNSDGLTILSAVAAMTGATPIDAYMSNNSKYLYVLNSSSHNIGGYAVNTDGSLNYIAEAGVLPAGTVGLLAK
ncbi:MAG: beta-propeller fold lactonase family protein [Ferruginibacter sp.]